MSLTALCLAACAAQVLRYAQYVFMSGWSAACVLPPRAHTKSVGGFDEPHRMNDSACLCWMPHPQLFRNEQIIDPPAHLAARREIHPLDTRSAGQSLNVFVNLLFTFVIGQSFLAMLCGMKFGVFLFFAGEHLHPFGPVAPVDTASQIILIQVRMSHALQLQAQHLPLGTWPKPCLLVHVTALVFWGQLSFIHIWAFSCASSFAAFCCSSSRCSCA